jgi:hypothetical protein
MLSKSLDGRKSVNVVHMEYVGVDEDLEQIVACKLRMRLKIVARHEKAQE